MTKNVLRRCLDSYTYKSVGTKNLLDHFQHCGSSQRMYGSNSSSRTETLMQQALLECWRHSVKKVTIVAKGKIRERTAAM